MDMLAILYNEVQESLSDTVTFEQILERDGTNHADNSKQKGKIVLNVLRAARQTRVSVL